MQKCDKSKRNYLLHQVLEFTHSHNSSITKEKDIKLLKNKAKFIELQNQINPHFLYNTLESIRGEALEQGVKSIADMTKTLAKFYRYNIDTYSDLVSFREELSNVVNYIKIQQYRFGDKISLRIDIPEESSHCFNFKILKLTLQPIVENSVYHGFETILQKGILTISVDITEQNFIIKISDDGCGMSEDILNNVNKKLLNTPVESKSVDGNNGIALSNINDRIKLYFGNSYGICVRSVLNFGTDIEITLPIITHIEDKGAEFE